MIIRKTAMSDLDTVCDIYAGAREFMRKSGNPNQWKNTNPSREVIESDIIAGKSYVCIDSNKTVAVFYFCIERDPTYGMINGAWLNDEPYGVVHRIARTAGTDSAKTSEGSGIGAFCLNWCFEQCGNLRVDTHRDNAPMQNRLKSLGFTYCGIIWLENGEERLAYQKVL